MQNTRSILLSMTLSVTICFDFAVEMGNIFDGFRDAEFVFSAILALFGLEHGHKPIKEFVA